jgi:hypothetical protein
VLALGAMLDRLGDALRSAAERRDATDGVVAEYAWFQARLAAYGAPSTRAEPSWCLLNTYGWSWARLLLSDGPRLLAAWDAAALDRGEAPLRRLRQGGAREGHGRRPGPVVHEVLGIAAIELADLLSAWRHRDLAVSGRLTSKARAVQQALGIAPDPEAYVSTLVRWAGLWLFLAAQLADAPFPEARLGCDRRARFREAARGGAGSAEWLAMTEALMFRDPDVHRALGSTAQRRANPGARGGPLPAAAVAVEIITGVSASTVERQAVACRRSSARPGRTTPDRLRIAIESPPSFADDNRTVLDVD